MPSKPVPAAEDIFSFVFTTDNIVHLAPYANDPSKKLIHSIPGNPSHVTFQLKTWNGGVYLHGMYRYFSKIVLVQFAPHPVVPQSICFELRLEHGDILFFDLKEDKTGADLCCQYFTLASATHSLHTIGRVLTFDTLCSPIFHAQRFVYDKHVMKLNQVVGRFFITHRYGFFFRGAFVLMSQETYQQYLADPQGTYLNIYFTEVLGKANPINPSTGRCCFNNKIKFSVAPSLAKSLHAICEIFSSYTERISAFGKEVTGWDETRLRLGREMMVTQQGEMEWDPLYQLLQEQHHHQQFVRSFLK